MKLLLFLTWREFRFRWRTLLPFALISAGLIFSLVSIVTFQECLNAVDPVGYMFSASNLILYAAFGLIGFAAAKTFFTLYSESRPGEAGTLRALGMKRRDIRRMRVLTGGICIVLAAVIAVPAAFAVICVLVDVCTAGDMSITNFVPLVYKIPVLNVGMVLGGMIAVLTGGVLTGYAREKSITAMLRSANRSPDAENDRGYLPEDGDLGDYGKLYVRRSLRRSVKYNAVTAFLLVLPVIFLIGATTVKTNRSTFAYSLESDYKTLFSEQMVAEIDRIKGVAHADARDYQVFSDTEGYAYIHIYTEDDADPVKLKEKLTEYADQYDVYFRDSAASRAENNRIARWYRLFFLTEAVILFLVGYITSFAMLKARLIGRKRELSLLHAIGARAEDVMRAVIPETVADYAFGALISILLGVVGIFGMMADSGGGLDIFSILLVCLIFLGGNVFLQIRSSRKMTAQILDHATAVKGDFQ